MLYYLKLYPAHFIGPYRLEYSVPNADRQQFIGLVGSWFLRHFFFPIFNLGIRCSLCGGCGNK
jgi:hypothetical protein